MKMKKIEKPRCDGCWHGDMLGDGLSVVCQLTHHDKNMLRENRCGQWRDKEPPYLTLYQKFERQEKAVEKNDGVVTVDGVTFPEQTALIIQGIRCFYKFDIPE